MHTIKVYKVKVRSHAEQYSSRYLKTNLAERGIFRRLPVDILGHEEQPFDLAVDRRRLIATVVLVVDLHDATMSCKDVPEVRLPAIAVDPDARRDVVAAAAADSHLIKTPEFIERPLY